MVIVQFRAEGWTQWLTVKSGLRFPNYAFFPRHTLDIIEPDNSIPGRCFSPRRPQGSQNEIILPGSHLRWGKYRENLSRGGIYQSIPSRIKYKSLSGPVVLPPTQSGAIDLP